MDPITQALNTLTTTLQALLGSAVTVTRDPAMVGPRLAQQGVAVLVGAAAPGEASSYRTWFLTVPVHVCFDSPADPRHMDPANSVVHQILGGDYYLTSSEVGPVQLDAAMSVPAITVNLQVSTEC